MTQPSKQLGQPGQPGQWGPGGPPTTSPFDPAWRRAFYRSDVRWLAGVVLVAALILITWQSLVAPTGVAGFAMQDKVVHFLAYGAVAGLGAIATRKVWGAAAFALIWGIGVEVAQGAMVLGREASLGDVAANGAGALLAAIVLSRLFRH